MKLLLVLFLWPALVSTLTLIECGDEARRPKLDDIAVECGTTAINLAIQMCPVVYTGYNESQLIMNHIASLACSATLDTSVDPPVARFSFPLNSTNACGSNFRYTSSAGTGVFADFSNIQNVNISGIIRGVDPTTGQITYNAELKYYYSCAYPLEYLVNNTQIDVSGSSVSITDRNGTFLSTLSLVLYSDPNFTTPFNMPASGIELRTNVYAEVAAKNLTAQYHVLLDRCYASISALPANSSFFNLFVPCSKDKSTSIIANGVGQSARFHFPAFRFIEQQNENVSTYYLHCITRLCEKSTCSTFKECSSARRRREIKELDPNSVYTLTSPEIITKPNSPISGAQKADKNEGTSSSVGLGVAVGILATICVIGAIVGAVIYKKVKK
ncbi:zona pellucida-like domain-containing protein 1 [Eucyclogobius newberryi]|uniref:zona pellucida-like domain-containing protein 1 n=1 Tax=Eucyclogobius newberryi TaxID=166745 RepID=UPI003B59691B